MEKTGLGHQYHKDEKAYLACKHSLNIAFDDLRDINNEEANLIKLEIQKLNTRCWELAHAAFEAFKQNQS